jgi:hypothetical protein
MEIVFKIKRQNLQKAKDVLLKDEKVSRASVLFKESSSLGFEGDEYFCYISGLEEACERARELMKDLGKVVNEEEMKKIIDKVKEEEESAMTGFGNIFG